MEGIYKLLLVFLISTNTTAKSEGFDGCSDENVDLRSGKCIRVVSPTFCEETSPPEDTAGKDNLKEVHTYAELKNDRHSSLPESFTICSTITAINCPSQLQPRFFNILNNELRQILAPVIYPFIESKLSISTAAAKTIPILGLIPPWFPSQWTKSCTTINTTSGLIEWVVNGVAIQARVFEELKDSKIVPKDLSGKLVLGAASYGGKWFAVNNKVTNVNIFSSVLPTETLKEMTAGNRCGEEGDYLAWSDMEWVLHGEAKLETIAMEELCEGGPMVNLYYSKFPSMQSCMYHCENLGTRAPSVVSSEDWIALQSFMRTKLYDPGLPNLEIWLPITDQVTEDVWVDFYDGRPVENYTLPWVGSKPDGGRGENCVRTFDKNKWGDHKCDRRYACMCSYDPSFYLRLRGLCSNSAIDVFYKPLNSWKDYRQLTLQGIKNSLITYDEKQKGWNLKTGGSSVKAFSKAPHWSFTVGKHNWTIKGDNDCNVEEEYLKELKMSGCKDNEFTCSDGQCVSMLKRCNQLPNCRDESDERNCQILVLKDGYNKKVPPIESDDPVNVSVSINLLKLVDISEGDYSIEIQFEITMKWKENRATYHNLKDRESLNALPQEDFERLWLPKVIYENTDQKESTRLGSNWEWESKVLVKREGNFSRSGLDSVDENEIFEGHENRLVMGQVYTHTFQCGYEFSTYPFDTQVEKDC